MTDYYELSRRKNEFSWTWCQYKKCSYWSKLTFFRVWAKSFEPFLIKWPKTRKMAIFDQNKMTLNGPAMKWNEIEWNGITKWNEMEWNRMKWNEIEWNGMCGYKSESTYKISWMLAELTWDLVWSSPHIASQVYPRFDLGDQLLTAAIMTSLLWLLYFSTYLDLLWLDFDFFLCFFLTQNDF